MTDIYRPEKLQLNELGTLKRLQFPKFRLQADGYLPAGQVKVNDKLYLLKAVLQNREHIMGQD